MKDELKIKTTAPVRCGGKSLKLDTELVVGQALKLSEARSLVSRGKASWVSDEDEKKKGKSGKTKSNATPKPENDEDGTLSDSDNAGQKDESGQGAVNE